MISVFKKIWLFSGKERNNLTRSIVAAFFHAAFNAFQFVAIYYMLKCLFKQNVVQKDIIIVLVVLIISLIGKIITQNVSQMNQTHAGYFMAANKRIELGEKIKRVPMGFFNNFSLGKLTTLATTNLTQIESWIPVLLVNVLGGFLNTFIFVLSIFIINFEIGFVALIGMIVFLFVTFLMEKYSRKNAADMSNIQTRLTKNVLSTIQGMQVIKSYNLSGENNKSLNDAIDDSYKTTLSLEKMIIPYTITQRIVIGMTIVVMLLFCIKLNLSGNLSITDTVVLMIASFTIFDGLIGAGSNMAILRIAENAIDSYEYVNHMPDINEGNISSLIQNHNIDIKNIGFSYDNRRVLDNVTCIIKENEMTAIVGISGSGKTTLCNLIARFWDVNEGEIKIGGNNIKDYTVENLMDNISMVFQDVYLFEDTIENNIKFGNQNATREEVVNAAKKAQCHDFIISLPQGYNTSIGEGGASLSGGEKQRISIARAMLKDAPIIIFDEATANIDPENEDKLKLAIESLTKNKTVIMIAHRLKTIRNANQILVLNKGCIEQRGTHDELMRQDGIYKDFVNAKSMSEKWSLNN
jgi:multidrug ABC transporter